MASKSTNKETNRKTDGNSGAIWLLCAFLVYQIIGLIGMIWATLLSIDGDSGTEYIGLAILFYVLAPSFLFVFIYSLALVFGSHSLKDDALRKRQSLLTLNYVVLIAMYFAPLIVSSVFG